MCKKVLCLDLRLGGRTRSRARATSSLHQSSRRSKLWRTALGPDVGSTARRSALRKNRCLPRTQALALASRVFVSAVQKSPTDLEGVLAELKRQPAAGAR